MTFAEAISALHSAQDFLQGVATEKLKGDTDEALYLQSLGKTALKHLNDALPLLERLGAEAMAVGKQRQLQVEHDELKRQHETVLADLRKTKDELRKRPWIDGALIMQGEHEADIGVVGVTIAELQEYQKLITKLESRVARLDDTQAAQRELRDLTKR